MKKLFLGLAAMAGLFVSSAYAQLTYQTQLAPGQYMHASDRINSANGKYAAFFQGDGNLVVYRLADMSVVWSAGTAGTGANLVAMQGDGNFVIYKNDGTPQRTPVFNSQTAGLSPAVLKLTDYGQLGIFTNVATWSSNTADGSAKTNPDVVFGNNSVIPMDGRSYNNGSIGQYNLAFQGDGNVVIYRGNTALWSSKTSGEYITEAILYDYQLVFYKASGTSPTNIGNVSFDTRIWHEQSYLAFQSDGNLVIYAPMLMWATSSADVPPAAPHSDGVPCGGGNPYQCIPNIQPKYGITF